MKRLGVTGASGYIGGALLAAARSTEWEVVVLGRRPAASTASWRPSDLSSPPDARLLDGLDAVVHLAAHTGTGDDPGGDAEVAFATALARVAKARGIACVIASSQAASSDAASPYGRTKHAIESATRPLGAVILRPGLVVGGREAGLFGLLCRLARRSPLLPRLWPAPPVQPVHVDDLARALLSACDRPDLGGVVVAVAGPQVAFHRLLAMIARERIRRTRWFVPVPIALLRAGLRIAAPLLGGAMSPARLDSLVSLPPLDDTEAERVLGLSLRPPRDALARNGRPLRGLLREGDALARGLLGLRPPPSLLRRYARLLGMRGFVRALGAGEGHQAGPLELVAMDTPAARRSATPGSPAWRMDVVCRLAEAEPALADRFFPVPGSAGRLRFVRDLARAGMREVRVRLAALDVRGGSTG